MSDWGTEKRAGFALAALLADDRELARVRSAIADDLAADPRALYRALAGDDAGDKARLVAHLLSFVRPSLARLDRTLPARVGAAIATKLPHALARKQVADGVPMRPGFAASADLLPRLLRIARRSMEREGKPP